MDNRRLKQLLVGDFTRQRLIRSVLLIIVMTYIGLGLCAYFLAPKIAFQPPPSTYRDTGEVIKIKVANGNMISALYLPNENATYTILYSHGNGEDLGLARKLLENLRQSGFSVLAYDYEGYGTSTGSPSEQNVYQDIDAAYNYLTNILHVAPHRIIAHGRSLGGAAAIDLAARQPVAGLILESTFVSGSRIFNPFPIFPFDMFRNGDKLQTVKCPVLVIHGQSDKQIGFRHGERLYELASEPKMFLWVESAGHNDLTYVAGAKYDKALQDFQIMVSNNQTTTR